MHLSEAGRPTHPLPPPRQGTTRRFSFGRSLEHNRTQLRRGTAASVQRHLLICRTSRSAQHENSWSIWRRYIVEWKDGRWMMGWEGWGRKRSCPISRYYQTAAMLTDSRAQNSWKIPTRNESTGPDDGGSISDGGRPPRLSDVHWVLLAHGML